MEKQNKSTDRLTEKAFSRLMITSVLGILLCIVCLCSATWAWYNGNVSSSGNQLSAGRFDIIVTVVADDLSPITTTAGSDSAKRVTLGQTGTTYTVTLKMSDDTTVTKGFCTVTVNDGTPHYTDSIKSGVSDPFTFTYTATADGETLSFTPAWGYPSNAHVQNGGILIITP